MAEGARSQEEPVAVVLDLGGTQVRAALATRAGHLLWRDRRPSDAGEGKDALIARVEAAIDGAISRVDKERIAGIGMGLAGPIDPETGIMYNPPNLSALDGVSLKSLMQQKVRGPVLSGNDATLAALGEYTYGAGVGARMLVYMTISTGIGGGVVVEGRPMMGANGMASELGHMSVDRNGPRCKCGHVGCLESIASGTAIGDRARSLLNENRDSVMTDMVSGDPDRVSSATVFEAARGGDALAREILEDVAAALGAGLVNVLHIFNPDVIVLGGGVSTNWDYLKPTVESYIETHAMGHIRRLGFRLEASPLRDEVGLLGAAAMVWREISGA